MPRDAYKIPFRSSSIWNTPIGSSATRGSTGLALTTHASGRVAVDGIYICTDPTQPLKTLHTVNYIGGPTTDPQYEVVTPNYQIPAGTKVHIPPAMTSDGQMNSIAWLLDQDGQHGWQGQCLYVNSPGQPAPGEPGWARTRPKGPDDLYGAGDQGMHGGSRMSSLGGCIRQWEWEGTAPIQHVLSMNLCGFRFLSSAGTGYRWPATAADSGYADPSHKSYYGGSVPSMVMGTLVALSTGFDIAALTDSRVRRIATALRDYGAYICDNSAGAAQRDINAFSVEETIKNAWDSAGATFHSELQSVVLGLQVITNNSPTTVGGGGTPRVPVLEDVTVPTGSWGEILSMAFGRGGVWAPVATLKVPKGTTWAPWKATGLPGAAAWALGGTSVVEPPPQQQTDSFIGHYRANPVDNPDQAYFNLFGSWPTGAVSYYTTQPVNETYERARVARGTHVFLDFDWKDQPAGFTREIAEGTTTGMAWVDAKLAAAQRIKAYGITQGSEAIVVAGICHEWAVKVGQNVFTHVDDRDPAMFARAHDRIVSRARSLAPDVLVARWTGGLFYRQYDEPANAAITVFPDLYIFDDYVQDQDTFALPTNDWRGIVAFIKQQTATWGTGLRIAVGEFGIDKSHGDTRVAQYMADLPNALAEHGILGAMLFCRDKLDTGSGRNVAYDITAGTTPQGMAAYGTSVAEVRGAQNVAPSAPLNLRSTTVGATSVSLAWDAASVPGGARPVEEYHILDSSNRIIASTLDLDGAGGNPTATTVTVTGLTAGTVYDLRVEAYNGLTSAPSAVLRVTTSAATTPPSAPTSLRSTATTASTVAVAWNAATVPAGAPAITGYQVYQDGVLEATVSGSTLTYTITGLSASTTYAITVRATNGALSPASNTLTVTTSAVATQPPAAPTNVRTTNVGSTTINLAWNASTVPSGSPAVTEYRVFRGSTLAATVGGTTLTAVLTGLSASTAYPITVRAYNGQLSAASATLTVTTGAGGGPVTWQLIWDLPMTSRPSGIAGTTGIRTGVDRTYNRQSTQLSFGPEGCVILCEKDLTDPQYQAGAPVQGGAAAKTPYGLFSADVEFRGQPIPNYFRSEGTMIIKDYLGNGMFPAWWYRPMAGSTGGDGRGEVDWWEFNGGNPGGANSRWKTTLINTPYSGSTEQTTDQFADSFTAAAGALEPVDIEVRWRIEHTPSPEEYRVYVNNIQIGRMDEAMWIDDNNNAGDPIGDRDLYFQFKDPNKMWYFRATYQAGNGTSNSNAGVIPSNFTQSRLITKDVQHYRWVG